MEIKPDIRYLNDMKAVLFDQKWAKNAPYSELYYMYRGVKRKGELRYDITVIPPRMIGEEFVKTKGNRNSDDFPELYTVLEGETFFLMQKSEGKAVKDVLVFKMKKGDWVIIPPDYYVVAINPSKKLLKTANWVSKKNKNVYKELEEMHGACYFFTQRGWIKNKNYVKIPSLRFEKPLKSSPKKLDFLKK